MLICADDNYFVLFPFAKAELWHYNFLLKSYISECSGNIPIDTSMVTVTDTRNSTTMGADKAIFTNENDGHTWCTNNTSGNSKIMVIFL